MTAEGIPVLCMATLAAPMEYSSHSWDHSLETSHNDSAFSSLEIVQIDQNQVPNWG